MRSRLLRRAAVAPRAMAAPLAVATVMGMCASISAPAALAQEDGPPVASEGPILGGPPQPPTPTERTAECAVPEFSGDATQTPSPSRILDLDRAWDLATGRGQKVAVIDTGVTPHPRLGPVQPGGDYVSDGDGLQDCDGHGTIVAGLIAAAPSDDDGFAGVAPDAEILSIRQSSLAFGPAERGTLPEYQQVGDGYGTVSTLAAAVVRAVDLGATVINISQVACAPSAAELDDDMLGRSLRFAHDRGVVVVVAAGNLQGNGPCDAQNPIADPARPNGPAWDTVTTHVSPARWSDQVLTVGAVDARGAAMPFSIRGPWLGVAAPGTDIVSLDPTPGATGLVNRQLTAEGLSPFAGSSFSTAYVSGLAALLRERFPDAGPDEITDRIRATAHAPQSGHDEQIGAGVIDPVAALTDSTVPESGVGSVAFVEPTPPPEPDPLPRILAFSGAGLLLVLAGGGWAIALAVRRETRPEVTVDAVDDSY